MSADTARLIAQAREAAAYTKEPMYERLADALEAAEAQRDEWMAGCQEAVRMVDQLDKSCALLAAQRDTYRERLEWFAENGYSLRDRERARAALAGVAPPEAET